MAKEFKAKEPVKVRQKTLQDGNISLYLDIYTSGKRKYEFLKLYLIHERTREDKERNRQTMQLANAIKAKRIMEIQTGVYGFGQQDIAAETMFFSYYRGLQERRKGGDRGLWVSCLNHLMAYEKNKDISFRDITPEWVKGFKAYLDKVKKGGSSQHLSQNSKSRYFSKLAACLNRAVADDIIKVSPARNVENFKTEDGTRMYLTIEEVKKLARTDCEYPRVKDAFLFSCLTGLRRSDVVGITWGDVHKQGDFTRIIFRQQKTGGQEYLDITPQAAELMGERGNPTERVFENIYSSSYTNKIVQEWVLRAGIDKKITFHCGRHTFATMMLDLGTDLYTVSKLLGHRELSTTQIYAKVMDKNKQAAVAGIPDVLHWNKDGDKDI